MLNTRPQRFQGSDSERWENRLTHRWGNFDGQTMCGVCDAKPFHVAAEWPCGVNPPREPIEARVDSEAEEG